VAQMAQYLYALTLSNIDQFSDLFHYKNQEKICNSTITKDPITLRNVSVLKSKNYLRVRRPAARQTH